MKNIADNFDASTPPELIYVGKLRYCYRLSVGDAEEMLNEVGGIYSSLTHDIYRGEEYDRKKTQQFLDSIVSSELHFGHLISGPGSLVNEAHNVSHDGNYSPVKISPFEDNKEIVRWAVIDTCTVNLCDAVLYIEEVLDRRLVNELPEFTHKLRKGILMAGSRRGSVPAYICLRYHRVIAKLGEETSEGRHVRAYLYTMQGVMSNQEIADELEYTSAANITRSSREGQKIATGHGLPPLEAYESKKRSSKRGPKKKKPTFSG